MTFTRSSFQSGAFLEVACFNVESVLLADNCGADRIEFCTNRGSGGVTPPLSALQEISGKFKTPVHVMIRPRGGAFDYTDVEFAQMKDDIRNIMRIGGVASGFVFGILSADSQVDLDRNAELVALARPLPCTFHRAFDEIHDFRKALENVISCGFKAVLTSGGLPDAVAGAEVLRRLVREARGRIAIMPGGGVRSSNLRLLKSKTGANWFHSSAISDCGEDADEREICDLKASLLDID